MAAPDDDPTHPTLSFMAAAGLPPLAKEQATPDDDPTHPSLSFLAAAGLTKRELALSREMAIKTLLEKCGQNNIDINENLRRSILGEELFDEAENKVIRRDTFHKRQSILSELVRSRKESEILEEQDDVELIRELRSKYEVLKRRNVSFEVRIKDGSYKVEVPIQQEGNGGSQHIATVTNAGFVPRMMAALRNSQNTGSFKSYETKTIMEGVNLVLEAGKMYLILGGPGSGKSIRKLYHCVSKYI